MSLLQTVALLPKVGEELTAAGTVQDLHLIPFSADTSTMCQTPIIAAKVQNYLFMYQNEYRLLQSIINKGMFVTQNNTKCNFFFTLAAENNDDVLD